MLADIIKASNEAARAWQQAMDKMSVQARQATASMNGLRVVIVDIDQQMRGAGNRAADGTWLSDLCAAWVHPDCRGCDCRCHR